MLGSTRLRRISRSYWILNSTESGVFLIILDLNLRWFADVLYITAHKGVYVWPKRSGLEEEIICTGKKLSPRLTVVWTLKSLIIKIIVEYHNSNLSCVTSHVSVFYSFSIWWHSGLSLVWQHVIIKLPLIWHHYDVYIYNGNKIQMKLWMV